MFQSLRQSYVTRPLQGAPNCCSIDLNGLIKAYAYIFRICFKVIWKL